MGAKVKSNPDGVPACGCSQEPRSVQIASRGIATTRDMSRFGTALIGDIMTGAVDPAIVNPVCRTANVTLRSVEMEMRHNHGNAISLG